MNSRNKKQIEKILSLFKKYDERTKAVPLKEATNEYNSIR